LSKRGKKLGFFPFFFFEKIGRGVSTTETTTETTNHGEEEDSQTP
jgi:hypothetical protein